MSKRVRAPEPEAPRQNRARAVSELLPAIGGAAFKRFGFVQSSIVCRWSEIVERVNRFFGYAAVARIQIRQGEVAKPATRSPPVVREPVSAEIGQGLKAIADPELRAVLESLAAGVHATHALPKIR